MNQKRFIFGIVIFLIGITFYVFFSLSKNDEISPQKAKQNLKEGRYDFVVDVRTDKEWNEGHLQNTLHIPIGSFVQELPEKISNKNARILFVCKKGIRASGVATIARKLGYKNVQAMIGNYSELNN